MRTCPPFLPLPLSQCCNISPGMLYYFFFITKQEAQDNPNTWAESWQQGQQGQGSGIWTPLSLSHTNTGSKLLHNTHQRQTSHHLPPPSAALSIPEKITPIRRKVNSQKWRLATSTDLVCLLLTVLLYHAPRRDRSLTCCEKVNHRESAARLAVVLLLLLQVTEILSALSGAGGRYSERGSLAAAGIRKEESKVEPAGWEQEGELFISAFSCSSCCLRVSPHTCWVESGDLTPSHQGNTSLAYQILLPFHFPFSPLYLFCRFTAYNEPNIISLNKIISYAAAIQEELLLSENLNQDLFYIVESLPGAWLWP